MALSMLESGWLSLKINTVLDLDIFLDIQLGIRIYEK